MHIKRYLPSSSTIMFSVQPTTEIGKDSCIIGTACNFPLLLKDAHIMRLFLALHRSIFVGKTSNNIITGPFPLKARSLSLTKRERERSFEALYAVT